MNILVFSWRDPKHPFAGGAEQVMHQHMKGWVKAGHKVTLFSSKIEPLSNIETFEGIKIVRGGYQYLGVQLAGFFYYHKNKDKYDLVIDQFHGIPFFTPLYVQKPILAIIQESARNVWFLNPLPFPINLIVGILGYIVEPIIFPFYRNVQFMTGSNSAKQDVEDMGISQRNITVIPHGLIIRKPVPFPEKENIKTLIYLGVLSKDKGIEDALKCFYLVSKKAAFKFWVVGKPETKEYRKKLVSMIHKLNLSRNIKLFGFVSQQKKFELLARAHILINPSAHEGWGLVNIEANAMGTPVVAYGVAGCVDSVIDGKTGILVEKGDIKALSEKVVGLLGEVKKYSEFSQSASAWSKEFGWKKSREQSLALLKRLLYAH